MSVLHRVLFQRRALLCVPILMAFTSTLSATIILRAVNDPDQDPDEEYQQQMNSPCVIGDPSCKNPDELPFTLIQANESSYDASSPVYTVGLLKSLNLGDFIVGFDVNEAGPIQQISLFEILIDGTVFDSFNTPNTPVHPANNGNGFADFVFTGFPSLGGYDDEVTVQFHAVMPLANDGAEEFFLIPTLPPPGGDPTVPEPATMALLGAGLTIAGLVARRKSKLS